MKDQRFTDEALAPWRVVGDQPADDLALALLTAYDLDERDETEILTQAIRAVVAGKASPDDSVVAWLTGGPDLPTWADDRLIAAGQRFFWRWPMPIATTLFCASLPMAYAAPRGARVLGATSRLSQRPMVARRLAETGQMVFDAMRCTDSGPGAAGLGPAVVPPLALRPGSQGYLTTRTIRLLHAVVRQGLLRATQEPWHPEVVGLPVNQEDLLGTLLTFSVTVLDGLEELGVPVTRDEAAAYLHAWCAVGAVLGIDEELLPIELDDAHELALELAGREQAPSEDGTKLAGELLREMSLAMPKGCEDLPAALVHRLVPEAAAILGVPPARPLTRQMLDRACALTRSGSRWPVLRALVSGLGAQVGRSVLQMLIDREQQPDGPSYRLDSDLFRRAAGGGSWRRAEMRTKRRRRRGDTVGVGSHAGPTLDEARNALPVPRDRAVTADDVRLIASEGFPLWEDPKVMVSRNQQITAAYSNLSWRLAHVIAGAGDPDRPDHDAVDRDATPVLDANWCTFAAWSSRTIGTWIDDLPRPGTPSAAPTGWRQRLTAEEITRQVMIRTGGSSYRTLAAGNRAVFLEIGLSIALFVEQFHDRAAALTEPEKRWDCYWSLVEGRLKEFEQLDPSWLLTESPPPHELRMGLRQYFEALSIDDPDRRSQHVLAGNLLLAAYEQRRVDGYVWAALALFSERAMQRLIRDRTGLLAGARRWPSNLFALALTRRMELFLPDETLKICQPVPAAPQPVHRYRRLATDENISLPLLQALISRYQRPIGDQPTEGADNWTSFDQRMRVITNLFRTRQRQHTLFNHPLGNGPTGSAP
jgi:hypothetical protein